MVQFLNVVKPLVGEVRLGFFDLKGFQKLGINMFESEVAAGHY